MSEPASFTFAMTVEFARAALPRVEQALWMQNERLHQHLDQRMAWRRNLRPLGIAIALLGLAIAALGSLTIVRHRALLAGMGAVFAGFVLIFLRLDALNLALRRFARRTVGVTARRLMDPVAARAPYTISYQLDGHVLRTQVEKLKIKSEFDLRQVRLAIASTDFVCLFHRSFAQRPARTVYVPGPAELAALRSALTGLGAEVLELR